MTDLELWWITLVAAVTAGIVSVTTSLLAKRRASWLTPRRRVMLELVSYAIMSVSVLTFVARGLMTVGSTQ